MVQTIKNIFLPPFNDIIKTVFSKPFFVFSLLSSKMSRNMCKLCHKVCNAKHWVATITHIYLVEGVSHKFTGPHLEGPTYPDLEYSGASGLGHTSFPAVQFIGLHYSVLTGGQVRNGAL